MCSCSRWVFPSVSLCKSGVSGKVIRLLCFCLTGALSAKVAQHTHTSLQLLPIHPPKHKFRYRHSLNRGLIVLLLCEYVCLRACVCMCVPACPCVHVRRNAAWTLKAWITPILQTWSVTIETRRWVYSPHASESDTHSTVQHTHARSLLGMALRTSLLLKNCRDYELEKVINTNNGKEHASSFSHI